jgi:hypothetical protein
MIPFSLVVALLVAPPAIAADQEDPDPQETLEERIASVNEGTLHFLAEPPPRPVHHHANRIRILESSLADGWVRLEQCHEHLDPVPATQILFHPERIRDIRVLATEGIARAYVEGPSVQLEEIAQGARLCLSAQSRALHALPGGRYRLQNGPYMRRFLDGYYPMRVSLEIEYPPARLSLWGHEPDPQPGFRVSERPGRVSADAWFEGRLTTRFLFCRAGDAPCRAPRD